MRYRIFCLAVLVCLPLLLQAEEWIYRIRPGETLSGISARYLRPEISAAQLQVHNKIEKDRAIPIGTKILIPLEWLLQSPAGAEVVFVRGEVLLYRAGSQEPIPLDNQASLALNDRITTGADAVLSIRFADGSRLLLGPQSEVVFDTLSSYGETGMIDTRLRVQRGRVESRVKLLRGEGSRYEIHTPAAVTMVRGTGFRVAVEGATGLTRSEVTEGHVAVAAGGETVSVNAGFGTLVEAGKPPATPRKLLPAPDLSGLPAEIDSGTIRFTWPPLDEAKGYRLKLQIQMADEEDIVLRDVLSETSSKSLEILQPGKYQLSIRGIDKLGLEGLSASHVFQVNLRPLLKSPDLTTLPVAVEKGSIPLQWSSEEGASRYRIQLSTVGDAETVLLDSETPDPAYTLENLQPGEYQIAISGIDVYDREGQAGLHRLLVYPPRLASPDLSDFPTAVEMGTVPLYWSPLAGASGYRIKLSNSGDADALLLDKKIKEPAFTLENLQAGEYKVEINGIDVYDREGQAGLHRLLVYPPRLASPDLSGLPSAVEIGPVPLQWSPLDGASGYRIKINAVGNLNEILSDSKTPDSAYTLENLQPGEYQIAISGIDVYDREGQAGLHRLLVYPPRLASPDLSDFPTAVEMGAVQLQWSPLAGAVGYQIRLSAGGDAGTVLLDKKIKDQTYTLENLQAGEYQIEINAIDKYRREGMGGLHLLRVMPPPLAPPDLSVLPTVVEEGSVTFQWGALPGAESYRFQLWRGGEASELLQDVVTDQTTFAIQSMRPGVYQLAVWGMDTYGRKGASGLHDFQVKPLPLVAPDLSALPEIVEESSITLQWPDLDGAVSYRVVMRSPDQVGPIFLDALSQEAAYTLENLQPGVYQLSISGIDGYGQEGLSGLYRFHMQPRPLPPPDLSTIPAVVEAGEVRFQWPELERAQSYRLLLRSAGETDVVLQDISTEQATSVIEHLKPGAYRLSVSGIDAYGLEGESARQALQVNPPPLPPPDLSILPSVVEEGALAIQWPALDGVVSYNIQLWQVKEGETDRVLFDLSSEQPTYTFKNLQPGTYRLSVSGLDAYGVEGYVGWQDIQVNQRPRDLPVLAMPQFGPGWMAFNWSRVEDAWGYRLLIARDSTFREPLFERTGQITGSRLPFYWGGRLFVRVDALFKAAPTESHSGVYRIELPWR